MLRGKKAASFAMTVFCICIAALLPLREGWAQYPTVELAPSMRMTPGTTDTTIRVRLTNPDSEYSGFCQVQGHAIAPDNITQKDARFSLVSLIYGRDFKKFENDSTEITLAGPTNGGTSSSLQIFRIAAYDGSSSTWIAKDPNSKIRSVTFEDGKPVKKVFLNSGNYDSNSFAGYIAHFSNKIIGKDTQGKKYDGATLELSWTPSKPALVSDQDTIWVLPHPMHQAYFVMKQSWDAEVDWNVVNSISIKKYDWDTLRQVWVSKDTVLPASLVGKATANSNDSAYKYISYISQTNDTEYYYFTQMTRAQPYDEGDCPLSFIFQIRPVQAGNGLGMQSWYKRTESDSTYFRSTGGISINEKIRDGLEYTRMARFWMNPYFKGSGDVYRFKTYYPFDSSLISYGVSFDSTTHQLKDGKFGIYKLISTIEDYQYIGSTSDTTDRYGFRMVAKSPTHIWFAVGPGMGSSFGRMATYDTQAPAVPASVGLVYPKAGQEYNKVDTVRFIWRKAPTSQKVTSYHLKVGAFSNGYVSDIDTVVSDTSMIAHIRPTGGEHVWSVQANNMLGPGGVDSSEFVVNPTAVAEPIMPKESELGNVYPTPTTGAFNLNFTLPQEGRTIVDVRDEMGRVMESITAGNSAAGLHDFHGTLNTHLPNGIYFVRIRGQRVAVPLLLVR